MKILDRYILTTYLKTFLSVFIILMLIFVLQAIWLYISELAGKDLEMYFVFKFLMVLLWTYVLQELCKYGYIKVSWFLVLLPFIFFALSMIFVITMIVTH